MDPLDNDEQLLWSGRPERPQRWFPEHFIMLFGTLALVGILGTWVAIHDSPEAFFALFTGLPGFLVITHAQLQRRRSRTYATTYLVTDQRIIFATRWQSGVEYRWVRFSRLGPPRVKVDEHGIGTITFGKSGRQPDPHTRASFAPDLRAIADARRVAGLIAGAQHGPPRS
ncbi:hypothetical protein [Amycolatopsis sp. NPDC098790]|uniref:hypothetical protein n=1 Tax=Amycolatopsis sp. NPDC098790 TaxID=3363939 RepID=UPI0037F86A7F